MAISTIRRSDDSDAARVREAAERFCARHGLSYDADEPRGAECAIQYQIECGGPQGDPCVRTRKLWTACYCRALGVPVDVRTTIAWGYVGIRVA